MIKQVDKIWMDGEMVDWEKANACWGEHVAFCGNVDPVGVMLHGTPETVYSSILDCLRSGGSRCFSGAGCEIPDRTTAENLHAHSRALSDWGAGPQVHLDSRTKVVS